MQGLHLVIEVPDIENVLRGFGIFRLSQSGSNLTNLRLVNLRLAKLQSVYSFSS